ncbi:MAG: aminotransferase class I/II-fold pyridoxal phosphate-dependent enzyme [Acidobacteriota bacterium]
MKIEQFEMERMQSTWENLVRYNLSESGVHPVAINELITDEKDQRALIETELGYSQANGTPALRQSVASLYEGATEENILVTTGTAEANFITSWVITEPGDEVILMLPNYMQLWGLFRGWGAEVRPLWLREEKNWSPDFDALTRALSSKTRLIAVCNPNNPTGAIMSETEMNRIIEAARSTGAWLLADEVYRGAERSGEMTLSFWGRYEKTIITSGLSKAYGLPGLRIGWIASAPEMVARAWAYHDYTTIGPGPVSDMLACIALRPEVRARLLDRTRRILNSNFPVLREWIASHGEMFSLIEPRAGAIAYIKYNLDVDSLELVNRLKDSRSVLIVPGAHFQMKNYLRIGFGSDADYLRAGLELIDDFLSEIQPLRAAK